MTLPKWKYYYENCDDDEYDEYGENDEYDEVISRDMHEDEYFQAYCSDPIHEITQTAEYDEDYLYDLFLNRETEQEWEKEEYDIPFAEAKIRFLLDELREWGCNPFEYDLLMQNDTYQNQFYVERLPLVAGVIWKVILDVKDENLISKAYAYCAFIYSMTGDFEKAQQCLSPYVEKNYEECEQICRVYQNIKFFNRNIANEMIQKCIDLLENDSCMDGYYRANMAKKYCQICGDKKKVQLYQKLLSDIIEEKTGFSFVEI